MSTDPPISSAQTPGMKGWGGLYWGDPPPPGMVLVSRKGRVTTYKRTGFREDAGPVQINQVVYSFVDDKLSDVAIDVAPHNAYLMLQRLEGLFGRRTQKDKRTKRYSWSGLSAYVSYYTNQDGCTVIYADFRLSDARAAAEREYAAGGAPVTKPTNTLAPSSTPINHTPFFILLAIFFTVMIAGALIMR